MFDEKTTLIYPETENINTIVVLLTVVSEIINHAMTFSYINNYRYASFLAYTGIFCSQTSVLKIIRPL